MDDDERERLAKFRIAFDDEQNRRARERQLIVFGAMLASKQLRQQLKESDFADARIGSAAEDLGKPQPTRISLRCVMSDVGAGEWEPTDGNPLNLLIEHVKLDARLAVSWRDVQKSIDHTNAVRSMGTKEKRAALEHVERVVDEADRLFKRAREAAEENRSSPPHSPPRTSEASPLRESEKA